MYGEIDEVCGAICDGGKSGAAIGVVAGVDGVDGVDVANDYFLGLRIMTSLGPEVVD